MKRILMLVLFVVFTATPAFPDTDLEAEKREAERRVVAPVVWTVSASSSVVPGG